MPSHWPTPWLSTSCASTPRSGMQGLQARASLPREFREAGGLSERALKSATDYINDNLASELTLAEIAGVANLSPHHFARMFKQSTGMPPHRYLIGQRLECAKGLLARTELSISEVAQACGFSHQGHLARHFRNVLGTTPGEFRRQCSR